MRTVRSRESPSSSGAKVVQELRDLGLKTVTIALPPETPPEIAQACRRSQPGSRSTNSIEHKTQNLDKVKALDSITFLVTDESTRSMVERRRCCRRCDCERDQPRTRSEQPTAEPLDSNDACRRRQLRWQMRSGAEIRSL